MKKTYTIEEIRCYLEGNKLLNGYGKDPNNWNASLCNAITLLEDKEDGIEVALNRAHKRHHSIIRVFISEVIEAARTMFRKPKK